MKPTRIFATASLVLSSLALITAANISIGDEGVVRMSSLRPQEGTTPAPVPETAPAPGAVESAPAPGPYPQPQTVAPYFERTVGATELVPGVYPVEQPFGPILMFETNLGGGIGYTDGSQRINARMPYHIVPNTMVMLGDVSGGVTWDGQPYVSGGGVYRYYDPSRNRVFGTNLFFDYDEGLGFGNQTRATAGVEALGKYVDFRANAYLMTGDDSTLLSSNVLPNIALFGNNAFRQTEQVRANAYSGGDFELGGPLPLLGRYGMNMYPGMYYLTNDYGHDALGFQVRWEALITQNLTVNTTLAHDSTFDTNTFVGIQYEIPNYRQQRTFHPRITRERLMDPVIRHTRIHQRIDTIVQNDALINPTSGNPWNIIYVDPNLLVPGSGTFESPYSTMQLAKANNNAGVDIIRIAPRDDDSGTNLTINGGLSLFNNQVLLSSQLPFQLEPGAVIPADVNPNPPLAPLLSDPVMGAGGSVVRLANNNQILGLRIDGANAAGTVFGNAVSNPLPITNVTLVGNEFTNYLDGARLTNVSGRIVITDNIFDGRDLVSQDGLDLTIAGGGVANLLLENNEAVNNSGYGLSVVAQAGSRLNADNPNGTVPTGVLDNIATDNGTGIRLEAQNGARINAVVEGNTAAQNDGDGLQMIANNAQFNLASLAENVLDANGGNGALIHYLNGGIFQAVTEDGNQNGVLDIGEDLNGNGRLDAGIVNNLMSNNQIAGLCIFGEDASTGVFDIGGPATELGNRFIGNLNAGIAVDLRDTATAQMDVLNNIVSADAATNTTPTLTYILDFVDPGQTIVDPFFGGTFTPFDVTGFGFAASEYDTVTQAVLDTVRSHFYNIPTVSQDSRSPMPDGKQLDINFVIGDLGQPPSIGATEYYNAVIGSNAAAGGGILGVANLSSVRDANGNGPNAVTSGGHAVSIFSDAINGLGGLSPADLSSLPPGSILDVIGPGSSPIYNDALTSGNLTFTRNAIAGTISHEIGHSLSLTHMNLAGSVTPNGTAPIMGTGAIDTPNQARIGRREFGYSGFDGENGNAPIFHVQQLMGALGVRDAAVAGVSGDGIRINATDSARLQPSSFLLNTITNNSGDGLAVRMADFSAAEGLTIQGNTIQTNSGSGVILQASNSAFIDADSTIGGTGSLVFGTRSFAQGNTITGNQGDGLRIHAIDGGVIHGNALRNRIEQNAQNGLALLIENGGTIDFGTPASNRVIRENSIQRNGGAGILLSSNASASSQADMQASIFGNTISGNVRGGIRSNQTGTNNTPPNPPAVVDNNRLDLTIGSSLDADANTLDGNGEYGIGVNVSGNASARVGIFNTTVTGTLGGTTAPESGTGIYFGRSGTSLLLAELEDVQSTGNKGNGLAVETQGTDKAAVQQPMSGTANNVTVADSNFSNNVRNGALFRTRGDSTLIADVTNSTFSTNSPSASTDVSPAGQSNGILIETFENSSFGDPADGLPPGRRSRFEGLVVDGNRDDGIRINVAEESRALVEITSAPAAATTSPHAAASALGSSRISNNGQNGIRINSTGGRTDVLVTSTPGATTTISGNGTTAGGNGIRWDASGNSDGTVRVTNTTIRGSIRGLSEDANNDGVLTAAEDANNNGDIDIVDGDGIQANFSNTTNAQLIVGNVGQGNIIQGNQDDGIAITATGDFVNGVSRPIITITDNTIGGFLNGIPAGNGGDGVSLNVFGDTRIGIDTASVDFTAPDLSPNGGITDFGPVIGPIPQLTLTNNVISNNADRGVNLLLTGAAGTRDRSSGSIFFAPVRISLNDNVIDANGSEGVFYRADADLNQSKFVYLGNTGFPSDDRLAPFWDPGLPQFTFLNFGSVNGNTMYMEPYLNLESLQNSLFNVVGNTIRNNGTGGVTGEGIRLEVGTSSYVAADIRNNTLGGNLEADLATASFLSAGNTFDSANTSGVNTFDYIYLDDIAQLDLRFQNNTGNQIAPSDLGAVYTNRDLLKESVLGIIGVVNRDASFFQVDNGPNLNSPNNTFINFGATQDVQNAFTNGNFNLRSIGDPAWPNPGFTPFLP